MSQSRKRKRKAEKLFQIKGDKGYDKQIMCKIPDWILDQEKKGHCKDNYKFE